MTVWRLDLTYSATGRQAPFTLACQASWQARATGLYGPSGSGKTTLLEILLGLREKRRVRGLIEVGGRRLVDSAAGLTVPSTQRRFGWVPQDGSLFPHLTVESNLRYGAPRTTDPTDVVQLLELTPLLGRRTAELSGGERQRAALGRALLAPHDALLLDEPFAALDPRRRSALLGYVRRIVDERQTPIIYVSHDWSEIRALCSFVLVLDRGRLVAQGTPSDVEHVALAI